MGKQYSYKDLLVSAKYYNDPDENGVLRKYGDITVRMTGKQNEATISFNHLPVYGIEIRPLTTGEIERITSLFIRSNYEVIRKALNTHLQTPYAFLKMLETSRNTVSDRKSDKPFDCEAFFKEALEKFVSRSDTEL